MNAFPWAWIRSNKWKLLLVGITSLLVISPISEIFDEQDNVISPLTALVIIAVAFGATENRTTIAWMTALTLLWLVISIVTDGSGLFAGKSLLAPALFMFLLVVIFVLLARWLLRVVHINAEVLCAAICGYLIIGMLWTGLYFFMNIALPKSLISLSDPKISPSDLFYFSYITLTTTGFGDIIPKDPTVRMLAVMEAVVGTFYNTIVIARFVGLYGLRQTRPE